MRRIPDEVFELVKRVEGLVLDPYLCPAGYLTVGFGHRTSSMDSITEEEAEKLLKEDLYRAGKSVLRLIRVPLLDGLYGALVSFTFNLGGGALQRSTLRMRLNRGEKDVENEFLKWIYAGGRPLRGLLRRRQAEINLFIRG